MSSRAIWLAFGSPEGLQSTVWKFWTQGDETYVQSRMMGTTGKISLHKSGFCSWAMTEDWMRRPEAAHFRGQTRHMYSWRIDRSATLPVLACRIVVPHAEMRANANPESSLQKVTWLTPPEAGHHGTIVACYIPPPNEPRSVFPSPFVTIQFLPVKSGGGVLVGGSLALETPEERAEINERKAEIRQTHLKMGHNPIQPQYSGVLVNTADPFPTFIEITPSESTEKVTAPA